MTDTGVEWWWWSGGGVVVVVVGQCTVYSTGACRTEWYSSISQFPLVSQSVNTGGDDTDSHNVTRPHPATSQ